jgi:hypothetical protein
MGCFDQGPTGYIAVDFDGTLSYYEKGMFPELGEPIPAMLERVKKWVEEGQTVKIFTARVDDRLIDDVYAPYDNTPYFESQKQRLAIKNWCIKHIGVPLEVTNCKDQHMYLLFDDRAVAVSENEGRCLSHRPLTELV